MFKYLRKYVGCIITGITLGIGICLYFSNTVVVEYQIENYRGGIHDTFEMSVPEFLTFGRKIKTITVPKKEDTMGESVVNIITIKHRVKEPFLAIIRSEEIVTETTVSIFIDGRLYRKLPQIHPNYKSYKTVSDYLGAKQFYGVAQIYIMGNKKYY